MAPHSITLAWKIPWKRSLEGCSPWGRWGSDTTQWLHFHFSLSCIGEGNGNPHQCSCRENPRDGGAWWAAVYGVAQSRTRLKCRTELDTTEVSHRVGHDWSDLAAAETDKGTLGNIFAWTTSICVWTIAFNNWGSRFLLEALILPAEPGKLLFILQTCDVITKQTFRARNTVLGTELALLVSQQRKTLWMRCAVWDEHLFQQGLGSPGRMQGSPG